MIFSKEQKNFQKCHTLNDILFFFHKTFSFQINWHCPIKTQVNISGIHLCLYLPKYTSNYKQFMQTKNN